MDSYKIIKTAIFEKKLVEFDYYGTTGEETHRIVEPIQLRFKHRSWYLKAFCLEKQAERLFKIMRMTNMVLGEQGFSERVPDYTPIKPNTNELNMLVRLKLKISKELAYRVYDEFDPDNIIVQKNGDFVAYATYPEDNWIYGHLLSYGTSLQVLEPKHIRDGLKEKLEETLKNYL